MRLIASAIVTGLLAAAVVGGFQLAVHGQAAPAPQAPAQPAGPPPVSYTHLTLPTILRV